MFVNVYPETRNLEKDLAYIQSVEKSIDTTGKGVLSELKKQNEYLTFMDSFIEYMETQEGKDAKIHFGTLSTVDLKNIHSFAKPINPDAVSYPVKYPVNYNEMVKITKEYPDTWVTITVKHQGFAVVSVLDRLFIILEN